jgi:hypothetical protein
MLKTAFDNTSTGRSQISEWFSEFKHRILLVEDCLHQPSTRHQDKNANKLHRITNITETSQLMLLTWNNPANPEEEPDKHNRSEGCSPSIAH